ncbi:MAG TPA: asparagine synthase-related protein [Gemmatimonadaceae bacterium]|nr:asparagine synthase-related protein [Gemmatimonadaceae bacterium]
MSVILAVVGDSAASLDDATISRALTSMRAGASDRTAIWRGEGAMLAVARQSWEMSPTFSGDALVVTDGEVAVVADASLYYRDDLRAALARARVAATGDSASHLILAAYRAWGADCAQHLEGDFAFVIWDARARTVVAARDLSGKRTLFFSPLRNGGDELLVLASTAGGALALPGANTSLNLTVIAETAAGLWGGSAETCYESVRVLQGGETLVRIDNSPSRTYQHWNPPRASTRNSPPFEEAAIELRKLLTRATTERLDSEGDTSIWLSGGWDSPAVFAAGAHALDVGHSTHKLLPVSISYPEGDPGREDELIREIAARWNASVHWLDIQDIPFFDNPAERAAVRDEPFAHPFEMWHRSLARGTRATHSRVALEGVGGDQLFQVSEVYLADLLRTGRVAALAREWKAKGMSNSGFRNFFRWAIQPNLPRPALALARAVRGGRPLVSYLERSLPPWIDSRFARAHSLDERDRLYAPRITHGSRADRETAWYLSHQYFPRVFGAVSTFAREEGVEIRSPLYDKRVIEFALTRPREERSSGVETKKLLRASMRGLLPDSILATRTKRTGVTGGYFGRSMREHLPAMVDAVFDHSLLEDAGVIDAKAFKQSVREYARGVQSNFSVGLYFTLQSELWLRSHIVTHH